MSKETSIEQNMGTEISFGGRTAGCHIVSPTTSESALRTLIKTKPHASVLLVFGGADDLDKTKFPDIKTLLRRGLVAAAGKHASVVIDGGTHSGIMQLMGEALAEENDQLQLIGVAPEAKVSYPGKTGHHLAPLDPNHSDFVLVRGADWGDETPTIFKLAAALALPPEPLGGGEELSCCRCAGGRR